MTLFQKTDAEFYSKFPEKSGQKLTNTPSDKAYRDEYMKMYETNKKSEAEKGQKAGSPKKDCPDKDKKENKQSTTCKANSLQVSKSGSTYKLNVPGTTVNFKSKVYKDVDMLEIVSGPEKKPSDITIDVHGLVGPCVTTHKSKAFNYSKNDIKVTAVTDSSFKAKVFSVEISEGNSFKAIYQSIRTFFDKDCYCLPHDIDFNTCGFSNSVTLKVYPDLSFNGSMKVNFETSFKKSGTRLWREEKESGGTPFGSRLEYSLTLKHAGNKLVDFNQKTAKKDEGSDFETFLNTLFDGISLLSQGLSCFFRDSQELKVAIKPSFTLGLALKEVPNLPFVDNEISVTLGFNPLFSLDANVDVSGAMLKAVPVLGAFIMALEAIKLADVFLGFIIKGDLSLEGNFSKFVNKDRFEDSKVKFTGSIKLNLQGHVKSEHKVWRFTYSMGYKIGAQSGIEVEECNIGYDTDGVFIPIKIKFLGIICYKQGWFNSGVSTQSNSVPDYVKEGEFSVVGAGEKDVEELSDKDKMQIVDPYELCDHKFYLIRNGQGGSNSGNSGNSGGAGHGGGGGGGGSWGGNNSGLGGGGGSWSGGGGQFGGGGAQGSW